MCSTREQPAIRNIHQVSFLCHNHVKVWLLCVWTHVLIKDSPLFSTFALLKCFNIWMNKPACICSICNEITNYTNITWVNSQLIQIQIKWHITAVVDIFNDITCNAILFSSLAEISTLFSMIHILFNVVIQQLVWEEVFHILCVCMISWQGILLCVLLHLFVSSATFNTLHINICISNMIPELTVHVSVKLLRVQQGMFAIKQMRKQVFCIIYNLFSWWFSVCCLTVSILFI